MISWLKIKDLSGVAEARRRARRRASALGFPSTKVEQVAIVVTEAAQNVLRHAGGGEVIVQTSGSPGAARLLVLVVDRGAGIGRLDRMMRDGETSSTSPGTGLGAMKRLSDRLDIYSSAGKGTFVSAEFWTRHEKYTGAPDDGAFRLVYPNEKICGDTVAIRRLGTLSLYLVCDGLGHGKNAAEPANLARRTFLASSETEPDRLLLEIGDALGNTRGAVASVVALDRSNGRLTHAGVGNITTLIVRNGDTKRMTVRDGMLGGQARTPYVETEILGHDDMLVMHSDGIATLRRLGEDAPLLQRSAPLIAGTILRDNLRGRDDASILVARMSQARTL